MTSLLDAGLCIYVLGNIYYVPYTGCLLAVYHGLAAWLASMHLEYVHHALMSPLAYIYIYIYRFYIWMAPSNPSAQTILDMHIHSVNASCTSLDIVPFQS